MKYLTPEEADKYVSVSDDMFKYPAEYFTLVPCVEKNWENVIYYTGKKKLRSIREGEGRYWIYILSNEAMPGLVKIGYTISSPEERAVQISRSTGVALPFKVEFAFKAHEGEFLEKEIHTYLDAYRVNSQREFFAISVDKAKDIVIEIGKKYN